MTKGRRPGFGSIRKLPSGRFQASVPISGKRLSLGTFETKSSARSAIAAAKVKIDSGKTAQLTRRRSALTSTEVFDFLEYYLTHKTVQGKPLAETTIALYRRLANLHLREFRGRRLDDISRIEVDNWFASKRQLGIETTVAKSYKLLKSLYGYAIELDLVELNPCRIRGAQNLSSGKTLPTADWDTALAICEAMPTELDRMLALLSLTGNLRYSEAIGLQVKHLVKAQSGGEGQYSVRVEGQLKRVSGAWVQTLPKTKAGIRTNYLPEWMTDELEPYLAGLNGPEDFLFKTVKGEPYRHDYHARAWRVATKSLGLDGQGYSHHSLRRSVATFLASKGANQDEVRTNLGHSSSVAAARYVKDTGRGSALANLMPKTRD